MRKNDDYILPVTPNPSPEAVDLLKFVYGISGKQTLTGQHCNPLVGSNRLAGVHKQIGYYPALFGQDFGFSAAGTWDGINFRQQIVDEAIRRHHEGFINTLMWHAVRPTDEEPVVFEESVQGKLTQDEWEQLISPGTELHERWKSQVDVIAWFLKQLREAAVPVLWRPYHEMNGDWFWWGKKTGTLGYQVLYEKLFERFVHFHGLNNLLWVFNANEIRGDIGPYSDYFPGSDKVDILATDVYRGGYAQHDYDDLLALAGDKPIALGEVGSIPSMEIIHSQPRWSWFMYWGDPSNLWRERDAMLDAYQDQITLNWGDLPWVKMNNPNIHHPILK